MVGTIISAADAECGNTMKLYYFHCAQNLTYRQPGNMEVRFLAGGCQYILATIFRRLISNSVVAMSQTGLVFEMLPYIGTGVDICCVVVNRFKRFQIDV